MQDEIGTAAGLIWNQLRDRGEATVAQIKKATKLKTPIFDWAIGWLARENAVVITPKKTSYSIRLK